ncbi:MAG: hypothetical protein Q8942_01025 [Bacillota bacterium]|nr:hypothetical protein [Bacillota bacterium]
MKLYHGNEKKVRNGLNLSVDFSKLQEMASEGLLSLSVKLGLETLKIMLEDEVASYAGEKGKHSENRTALIGMGMKNPVLYWEVKR